MISLVRSSDASWAYSERTAIDVARSDSSAEGGSLASLAKDATFTVGTMSFYPLYHPTVTYVLEAEESGEFLGIFQP